jgi:hypothetical protein
MVLAFKAAPINLTSTGSMMMLRDQREPKTTDGNGTTRKNEKQ